MEFEKITSRIGARASGIDLSGPVDAVTVAALSNGRRRHPALRR